MSIALPSTAKQGLSGLLGRKRRSADAPAPVQKKLDAQEIAKRFVHKEKKPAAKPAKLNANERQDRDRLTSLRGALYAED